MKRPWTPGPWLSEGSSIYKLIPEGRREINQFWAGFQTQKQLCSIEELYNNAKLASKAPEMAEILIRLVRLDRNSDDYLIHIERDAVKLLKSVGWENEND
jgi:hypothetical protein